jgi:hypothetical protein
MDWSTDNFKQEEQSMNAISYLETDTTGLGEAQRQAYNAAFYELGLRWHWDSSDYDCQMCVESQRAHLRRYVETSHPHMLRVYEADFLVNAIQTTMTRCLETGRIGDATLAAPKWAVLPHGETGF